MWLTIGTTTTGQLLFDFPRFGSIVVDRGAQILVCSARKGVERRTIEHLVLDQVVPLLLAHSGSLVLHASSVYCRGSGSLLFLGDSMRGKSSTAVAAARAGARFLGDDFAWVELQGGRPSIVPAGLGSRLWEDSLVTLGAGFSVRPVADYTAKSRLLIDHSGSSWSESIEIAALFFLGDRIEASAPPAIERIAPSRALFDLLGCTFRTSLTDAAQRQRVIDQCAALLDAVPVFSLHLPDSLERLEESAAQLLEYFRANVPLDLATATHDER